MNIYTGKEPNAGEGMLGERAVKRSASTTEEKDMILSFSRFFMPVLLMDTQNFTAVRTCLKNRRK
jgi:hypothetical protein